MSENLVPRWQGRLPALREALPPDAPGSPEWTAQAVFGGRQEFLRLLRTMVVGGGQAVDHRWRRLVSLSLVMEERGTECNLNQLCAALDVPGDELLAFVGQGVGELYGRLATIKAKMAAPEVIESAIWASRDLEKGRGDREMLLRIAGVIEPASGITINNTNSQQVAVAVNKEQLRAPLLKFRETQAAIDETVRAGGEVVEGELVQ